ncbi:MAG TPA: hypothetical protein VFT23_06060, partial [Burkholderiales bacterium]|nr:hypothetical protein [Burkholderiales bacterium]
AETLVECVDEIARQLIRGAIQESDNWRSRLGKHCERPRRCGGSQKIRELASSNDQGTRVILTLAGCTEKQAQACGGKMGRLPKSSVYSSWPQPREIRAQARKPRVDRFQAFHVQLACYAFGFSQNT